MCPSRPVPPAPGAPAPPLCPSPRLALLAAAVLVASAWHLAGAPPALALKVATWNVLNYPGADLAARQPNLRTVIAALDPDILALQELKSSAGRDSFLTNVLNVVQPGQWAATSYFATCESAVFYKPARVELTFGGVAIPTSGPRDVLAVLLKPRSYGSQLAEFRLYSVHFQAGPPSSSPADSAARRLEGTDLRNNLNAATPAVTPNFLVCGDTNFYGDWEGGYIRLTESQTDDDGRCADPLTMPGTWNQYAYRAHHTQSTCSSGCPTADWSMGGLDDRPDLFLTSYALRDGEGLDLMPASCVAFGNDGQHFNESVNALGFNYAVGVTVANALHSSSDHLPVMVTLQVPAQVAAAARLDFGSVIVGATAQQPLLVANGAVAPADELSYALVAPAGFAAPAGPFAAEAGAAGNTHQVAMATAAPGAQGGALIVACDDPDSTAKPVQLTGTVLAHAVASLDSTVVTTVDTLDFGTHAEGDFPELPVRVHNAGWGTLQARLAVTDATAAGGAGRFAVVGGFAPAEIAGVGHAYTLRFDAAGAALDSTYAATLVFSTADESLPGAAAAADLVVTLLARRSAGETDTAAGLPQRPAFHPPSPNPARTPTTLRFDLPREAEVALEVFDVSGRLAAVLLHERLPAGRHALRWDPAVGVGGPLAAGLYLVSFRTEGFTQTRRLVRLP